MSNHLDEIVDYEAQANPSSILRPLSKFHVFVNK